MLEFEFPSPESLSVCPAFFVAVVFFPPALALSSSSFQLHVIKKALIETGIVDFCCNILIKALEEIISPESLSESFFFFVHIFQELMPANGNTFTAASYINQAPRKFSK